MAPLIVLSGSKTVKQASIERWDLLPKKKEEEKDFLENDEAALAFVADMKACTDVKCKMLMLPHCEALSVCLPI